MKKIVIMRAISGAGKTTYAQKLGFSLVSADNYFMVDGKYAFDATKLGEAHQQCMRNFLKLVMAGQDIVVDNTNIGLEEIAPYVAVGEAMGYEVEVVQLDISPEVAAQRNVHSVSSASTHRMYNRLHSISLPKRWNVTHIGDVQ